MEAKIAVVKRLARMHAGLGGRHEHSPSGGRRTVLEHAVASGAFCVLLLVGLPVLGWLGLAVTARSAALGSAQQQEQSQGQSQSSGPGQTSSAQQSQAQSASPAKDSAAPKDKASTEKPADKPKRKHVFTEDDLSNLKGGVSVVGEGNTRGDSTVAAESDSSRSGSSGSNEKSWRDRAAQIHAQIDSLDDQVKALKEDIKKNGGSGFDAQSGLQQNRVYLIDKNAKVDNLEKKKKALEQKLEDLQDEARKAGVPSDWVR